MAKSFEERNKTDTARKKLRTLAKASGIDVELVSALANFTWDYDPKFRNEATGWVSNATLCDAAKRQLRWIAETVGLDPDFELAREKVGDDLIQAHGKQYSDTGWSTFCTAAGNKHNGRD